MQSYTLYHVQMIYEVQLDFFFFHFKISTHGLFFCLSRSSASCLLAKVMTSSLASLQVTKVITDDLTVHTSASLFLLYLSLVLYFPLSIILVFQIQFSDKGLRTLQLNQAADISQAKRHTFFEHFFQTELVCKAAKCMNFLNLKSALIC